MASWRQSRDYRLWRAKVIRRDKRCQICNSIKHRHAHHLDHASYFPEKRFDINNGICVCSECHKIFHTSFKRSYRQKSTREDFRQFIELFMRAKDNKLCKNMNSKQLAELRERLLDESNN